MAKYPAAATAAIARRHSQLSGSCSSLCAGADCVGVAVGEGCQVAVAEGLGVIVALGRGVSIAGAGVGVLFAGGVIAGKLSLSSK